MDPKIKEQIEKDVKGNKIMLYIKGTPESPMCGFSYSEPCASCC